MPAASLEIFIERLASGELSASARFAPDESVTNPSLIARPSPVAFDESALLALALEPEAYGQLLGAQLFAGPQLRAAWDGVRRAQERDASPLRVRLNLNDERGALHTLLWETLCDPEDGYPLALREQITLARGIETSSFAAVTRPAGPHLHALVAIASPSDLGVFGLADLDIAGEAQRAREALGELPATLLGADPGRRATRATLEAALREGPHLVSIVCHGSLLEDGPVLWLERPDGRADRLPGAELEAAIVGLRRPPLLVVLAACRSAGAGYGPGLLALGPSLARAGVPAVIGFQGEFPIESARLLLPVLYRELRRDGQIDRAMTAARRAVLPGQAWWQPVLWMRVRDGRLWDDPPSPGHSLPPPRPLAETLREQREQLGDYLDQLARFGKAYAPPHVLGGIREARHQIGRLKAQLRSLGEEPGDHPDDEA